MKNKASNSRLLFSAYLLSVFLMNALGQTTSGSSEDDLNYEVTNGTVIITKYIGSGGDVVIPATIKGLPVTSIGNYAFVNSAKTWYLTSVKIPPSVTSIGKSAFFNSTFLTSVEIPPSVIRLGESSFGSCGSMTNVTIPSSVTSIGYHAFSYCTSLTSVKIPSSVTNLEGWAFFECYNLANVSLPNSLTTIEIGTFGYCSSLKSITIPDSVTTIRSAFGSSGLTNLVIPDSVTIIEDRTFLRCTNLTNVVFGKNVSLIGVGAFTRCYLLANAYFKGNAPRTGYSIFEPQVTIYHVAGTTGWESIEFGVSTALWEPPEQLGLADSGVRNDQFGFYVTGLSGSVVVVEASVDFLKSVWSPLKTITLTGSKVYYSDPDWKKYPARFYRLRQL